MEGWMVTVNAIGLPEDSPFRNSEQVPLPMDPAGEVQVEEQVEDISEEEEGAESSESNELSRQIDSHVVVLDDDQLRNGAATSSLTAQPTVTFCPSSNVPQIDQWAPTTTSMAAVNPEYIYIYWETGQKRGKLFYC